MHKLRIVIGTIGSDPIGARAGIGYQIGIKSHIARHPYRGRDAHIREETDGDQAIDSTAAQVDFKTCSDESTVDVLFKNRLLGARFKAGLKSTSRFTKL